MKRKVIWGIKKCDAERRLGAVSDVAKSNEKWKGKDGKNERERHLSKVERKEKIKVSAERTTTSEPGQKKDAGKVSRHQEKKR